MLKPQVRIGAAAFLVLATVASVLLVIARLS
jgi:hypothetical protein